MDMKTNLKEQIKLVMCDIDGTILTSKQEVTIPTQEAIDALHENGKYFGLATGRPLAGVMKNLEKWHLEERCDFIVGSNGAQVFDRVHDHVIEQNFLSKEHIHSLVRKYQDMNISLCVYEGNTLVTNRSTPEYEIRCEIAGIDRKVTNLLEFVQKDYPKMLFVSNHEMQKQIIESYRPTSWYTLLASSEILTEVIDPSLSKVNGIQRVCDILGIQKENVLCFGDEMNDYAMLEAFVGVAMGNAVNPIYDLCSFHTVSNEEDGVADFILKRVI